ncbi:MAG TPA: type III secretion HpaP family protein [Terriglobales bacterium]|nr:type III secretion HpaP family protein [Terriglobales bacterium]
MRIDDNQPPLDDPSVNTDDVQSDDIDSGSTQSDQEPSAFSQLLAKKKAQDKDAASARPEKKQEGGNFAGSGFMRPELVRESSGPVGNIEGKHAVDLPPDLQQLVREISVATNQAGNEQVQIEMNSGVLKGLRVRIERQEGALAIQFQTDSLQVSNLISRNLDSLSEALSNLGEGGVNIRITSSRGSSKGPDFKDRGSQGGRAPGAYGGGRR